jgi:hypothetical protein
MEERQNSVTETSTIRDGGARNGLPAASYGVLKTIQQHEYILGPSSGAIQKGEGLRQMGQSILARSILLFFLLLTMVAGPLYGKEEKVQPKEYGVYLKTTQSLVRLLPNIVFNEQGLLYVESNKPMQFLLKDVQYFVVYGKYAINILTINPMLFLQASSLGKPRFILGKDIPIDVKNIGNDLYTVRPKDLLGRGYYCLWIEDQVWDFVIE